MCDLVELLRKNTSLLITRGGIPVGIKFYEVIKEKVMLKYKESKTNLPKDTYELNFNGWYGDMDYRYDKTHSVPKTPENEEIIDSILKIVGTNEIRDKKTTIEINELLEQLSPY